jgi:hypothetical protein
MELLQEGKRAAVELVVVVVVVVVIVVVVLVVDMLHENFAAR